MKRTTSALLCSSLLFVAVPAVAAPLSHSAATKEYKAWVKAPGNADVRQMNRSAAREHRLVPKAIASAVLTLAPLPMMALAAIHGEPASSASLAVGMLAGTGATLAAPGLFAIARQKVRDTTVAKAVAAKRIDPRTVARWVEARLISDPAKPASR